MPSCTFVKQRLKSDAWLHIQVTSLADLSHFLKVSCGTGREADALVARLSQAILVKALLSFAGSLYK